MTWREHGTETAPCPLIPEVEASKDICPDCRFFRGASGLFSPHGNHERFLCNWPRDGMYVAPDHRAPVPSVFGET